MAQENMKRRKKAGDLEAEVPTKRSKPSKQVVDIYPPYGKKMDELFSPQQTEPVVVEQQMLEEEIVVNKPKRSRKKKSDEPEGISIYHSHKHEEYTSDCQEPEEIIPEPKFERFRPRNKKKLVYIAGLIALSLILVSGFWYVGFGILPKATIDVSTKKSPLDFEENVLMDKSISQYDVTKRIIPAELLTFKEIWAFDIKSETSEEIITIYLFSKSSKNKFPLPFFNG